MIVFSRAFLSFSKDKNEALCFAGKKENKNSILYIIQAIENAKEDKKNKNSKIFNADLDSVSSKPSEKEVLIFPYSCFEICELKKSNIKNIDHEIHLKYLGCYSHYIKEQFDTNFFDLIQITTFSEELFNSGLLKINNILSKWVKKEENKNLKIQKICFFLEDEEDFISYIDNLIIIYNIHNKKMKNVIKIDDKITYIIKLKYNHICCSSKDCKIRIIKLFNNNREFKIIRTIEIKYNAIQMIFLENINTIFLLNEKNHLLYYYFEPEKYFSDYVVEEDKILKFAGLPNEKIIFITEKKDGNRFINLGDLKNIKDHKIKKESLKIEDSMNKLNIIKMEIFYDYILICYNSCIDIFNYQDNTNKIRKYLNYFDFELTNIIILSSNRIILGLYNSKKNESIIREHILRIEDLQNNEEKFDCLGEGTINEKKIINFIKINESQILINKENDSYMIYERKSEVGEIIRKGLKINENNIKKNTFLDISSDNNILFNNNENSIISDQSFKEINNEQNRLSNTSHQPLMRSLSFSGPSMSSVNLGKAYKNKMVNVNNNLINNYNTQLNNQNMGISPIYNNGYKFINNFSLYNYNNPFYNNIYSSNLNNNTFKKDNIINYNKVNQNIKDNQSKDNTYNSISKQEEKKEEKIKNENTNIMTILNS